MPMLMRMLNKNKNKNVNANKNANINSLNKPQGIVKNSKSTTCTKKSYGFD